MKIHNVFKILSVLHGTPTEIQREVGKKFSLIVTGTPELSTFFSCELMKDVVREKNEETASDGGPVQVKTIKLPARSEDDSAVSGDAVICLLSADDATNENLRAYRRLYKIIPGIHLFIERPTNKEEKAVLLKRLEENQIVGCELIRALTRETITDTFEAVLDINKKISMAMAYRLPVLRPAMAKKIINGTAAQNMLIALASSLPQQLPVIGVVIGLLSVAGETTVLTINQLKMCMQLAGIYGLELYVPDRLKELWPLIGSAIGLRAIARTTVGFMPLAGPALKGTIAYSGTYLIGEMVRWFYSSGRMLTEDERERIYIKARIRALDLLESYLKKIKDPPPASELTN